MPDIREVVIERLAAGGEGIARDGVRVPFALPGERWSGQVVDGVLAPAETSAPSPDRVAPVCRHFGVCGGCAFQHASDAFLADWKSGIVRSALAARGLDAPVGMAAVAPPGSRRRAVLAGLRRRKTTVVGFHARRSESVFDVVECPLVRPEIMAAKPALLALVRLGATRSRALRLGVTLSAAGLDVDASGGRDPDAELCAELAGVAEAHDLARLAWNGEVLALRRPPCQPMGAARVVPPPGAFLQPTAEGEAALVSQVCAMLEGAGRVVDLFAGCGTFALPLAASAAVLAVEGDAEMIAALDAGWRGAPGLSALHAEVRDLFRRPLQPSELAPFDGAVIDPPRAGAEAQVLALAASRIPRLAYVSCNPVSFARDAAILVGGGYRLRCVRVIDQFRWSAHVELVAEFSR